MERKIPSRMKAAVLREWGRLQVEEVDVPAMAPDEVLCRVGACGFCGSDIRIVGGVHKTSWSPTLPHIPGHEWSGEVAAVGEAVEKFRPGDRVVGETSRGCGHCRMCRTGNYHLCEHHGNLAKGFRMYGFNYPGAFAEYVVRPEEALVKMPSTMSFEEGAVAHVLSQAVHYVERAGVYAGDDVAVLGSGVQGLLVLQVARLKGAGRVFVSGRGARLDVARALGATEVLDYTRDDVTKRLLELTDGKGVDVTFECAGKTESLRTATDATRMGGRIALIGVTNKPEGVPLDTDTVALHEMTVYGMRGSPHTAEGAVSLVANGQVKTAPLVTKTFPLGDIQEAFHTFKNRQDGALGVIVKP
ncbi:MAG: alcohol dehydrogenase catalytic domain-containing protein [bacterium]